MADLVTTTPDLVFTNQGNALSLFINRENVLMAKDVRGNQVDVSKLLNKIFVENNQLSKQKIISENTILNESYNNAIIKITQTCIITIPLGLPYNFNCVIDVWVGTVTFDVSEVTISNSIGNILEEGKMATLYQDEENNIFRLRGELS